MFRVPEQDPKTWGGVLHMSGNNCTLRAMPESQTWIPGAVTRPARQAGQDICSVAWKHKGRERTLKG
jgi:hypothetical protein